MGIQKKPQSIFDEVKSENVQHQIFLTTQKAETGRCAFSDVKLSKMLRFFSVAEVHGLINPRPLGENFSFAKVVASGSDTCFARAYE